MFLCCFSVIQLVQIELCLVGPDVEGVQKGVKTKTLNKKLSKRFGRVDHKNKPAKTIKTKLNENFHKI